MTKVTMHPDEVDTSVELVRRLLATQFPAWADLAIEPVTSYGTDHDIYRLGPSLSVRLPRIGWATNQAAREAEWLPRLAPRLPLAVPVPVAMGRPEHGHPFAWSVYEWLPGANANEALLDLDQAAIDLAAFISALREVPTLGAFPRASGARGGPLAEHDTQVRAAIEQLGRRIDGRAALHAWDESLDAAAWAAPDVWVHGDLLPGNLLVAHGTLVAVIDFGGLNVGDPACDLQPAWNMFDGSNRARFRAALDADDASWLRGRGWVLCQTLLALPYYWDTNAGIVEQASRALQAVLEDVNRT